MHARKTKQNKKAVKMKSREILLMQSYLAPVQRPLEGSEVGHDGIHHHVELLHVFLDLYGVGGLALLHQVCGHLVDVLEAVGILLQLCLYGLWCRDGTTITRRCTMWYTQGTRCQLSTNIFGGFSLFTFY